MFFIFSISALDSHPSASNNCFQITGNPPDSLTNEIDGDESFTVGTGISFYIDSENAPGRSLLGYYTAFSIDKKISKNFLLKSGIDVYTVPSLNTKLVGNINLNMLYSFKISDKISMSLGTGLFTGFIKRKNSSGITSGALISTIIKYKVSKKYVVGINIKYPFFTEASGIILSNAFITF